MKKLKKNIWYWFFFDCGASAFATSVISVFYPSHLTTITKAASDSNGFVHVLGLSIRAGSFFPYIISISVLLQIILLPIIGAIADYANRKIERLAIFGYIGAFSTIAMYFIDGKAYIFGGILFIIANLSFGIAVVFYNSLLPIIAKYEERDSVSTIGWGIGYFAGGILLLFQLLLTNYMSSHSYAESQIYRICLGLSGIWWAFWITLTVIFLKIPNIVPKKQTNRNYIYSGFHDLKKTLLKLKNYPHTFLFLIAFFFYSDGIQTITNVASQFGHEELKLSVNILIKAILIVQFVGLSGAIIFNYISKFIGAKRTIIVTLFLFCMALVWSYGYLNGEPGFYALSIFFGLIIVASQALSRSSFSSMIPRGSEAEYFGIYEISERGSSWLGPLCFGIGLQLTGSYRIAILSLIIFFIIGIAFLSKVKFNKAIEEGNSQMLPAIPKIPG
ncbi:MAG: MFS transporter [Bacteroidetes bacterium]|nr:MAG: MFS transporter [Bacteroidota bacterium]